MHAVSATGELVLDRAEGVHVWDERASATSMRRAASGTATSATAAPRSPTRPPRSSAACRPYSHYGDLSSRPRPTSPTRIAADRADGRRGRLLHERRRRGGRDRGQARRAGTGACAASPERTIVVSRERAYHGLAGYGTSIVGTDTFTVGRRPARGRHAPRPLGRRGCARGGDRRGRPRARRRLLLRADRRRRRSLLPPPGYLEAARRGLPGARRALRRGRGDLRLRAGRRLVREHALRARPRPRHLRKGRDVGLPPARWRDRRRPRPRAVLGRGRRDLAPRVHVLGSRDRDGRRAREPRHHWSASPYPHARRRSRRSSRRRWNRSRRIRWSRRCAPGSVSLRRCRSSPDALADDPS